MLLKYAKPEQVEFSLYLPKQQHKDSMQKPVDEGYPQALFSAIKFLYMRVGLVSRAQVATVSVLVVF